MEDICDRLRRNDPTVTNCTVDLLRGAQVLEALQANTCVTVLFITFELSFRQPAVGFVAAGDLVAALAQFIMATQYVKTVWWGRFTSDVEGVAEELASKMVVFALRNPVIHELKFHGGMKLTTENVVAILQSPHIRKVGLVLHNALDVPAVADAFRANITLELLNLFETKDVEVVEAVLPRLSAHPALAELYVFGGLLGPGRGLPSSTTPNSLSYIAALVQTLVVSTTISELSLMAFVFNLETVSALVAGLRENQSISVLRFQCCWFTNDGCAEALAAFMKTVSATNPKLKHLDVLGCEAVGIYNPLPPLFVLASIQTLELGDHIVPLCQAWSANPNGVQLRRLVMRQVGDREWTTLVESLPAMKSLRELTITQLESLNQDIMVNYMRHHWNLQKILLHWDDTGASFFNERRQRLVDAYLMRNKHVPLMLATVGRDSSAEPPAKDTSSLLLVPDMFQTVTRTTSKPLHVLLLGLLAADDAIGTFQSKCLAL